MTDDKRQSQAEPGASAASTRATPRRRSRGKVVAVATTVALAGLTGVALNSNKGMPATPTAVVAAHGHAPVVTRTSGSPTAQPVTAAHVKHAPAQPVVTRTSGGGGGTAGFQDD